MYVVMQTSVCLSVCDQTVCMSGFTDTHTLGCFHVHLIKTFLAPADTPVPDNEIEKEENESSSQAQTPAEDSSVRVLHCLIRLSPLVVFFLERVFLSHCLPSLCSGAQAH